MYTNGNDLSSNPPRNVEAVVGGDDRHLWAYGFFGLILIVTLAIVIEAGRMIQHAKGGIWEYAGEPVCACATFSAFFFAVCIFWKRDILPVTYEVPTEAFLVKKNGVLEQSFPRDSIVDFRMKGSLDYRSFCTQFRDNPKWPNGEVLLSTGHGHRVRLPDIMIWGRSQVWQAERDNRNALELPD